MQGSRLGVILCDKIEVPNLKILIESRQGVGGQRFPVSSRMNLVLSNGGVPFRVRCRFRHRIGNVISGLSTKNKE